MISVEISPRSIEICFFLNQTSTKIVPETLYFLFLLQVSIEHNPRWPEFSLPFALCFQSWLDTTSRLPKSIIANFSMTITTPRLHRDLLSTFILSEIAKSWPDIYTFVFSLPFLSTKQNRV